jgi:hypothetical protein
MRFEVQWRKFIVYKMKEDKMWRKITIIAAFSSMLFGCQTSGSDVGEGYLNLGPKAQEGFDKYMSLSSPMYFAVSPSGNSYGYWYCKSNRCDDNGPSQALQYCQINSGGVPCKVYAKGKYVVWKNASNSRATSTPTPKYKAPEETTKSSSTSNMKGSARERLKQLKEMLSDGTISDADYEKKKQEILDSM